MVISSIFQLSQSGYSGKERTGQAHEKRKSHQAFRRFHCCTHRFSRSQQRERSRAQRPPPLGGTPAGKRGQTSMAPWCQQRRHQRYRDRKLHSNRLKTRVGRLLRFYPRGSSGRGTFRVENCLSPISTGSKSLAPPTVKFLLSRNGPLKSSAGQPFCVTTR